MWRLDRVGARREVSDSSESGDDLMKKSGRLELENDFLRRVSLTLGLNSEKRKQAKNILIQY